MRSKDTITTPTTSAFKALCKGFSKLNREARLERLYQAGFINEADRALLTQSTDQRLTDINDHLIENVIGSFPLPFGVATHFFIDHHHYLIPMVVEESSIIAAASANARWVKENGTLYTEIEGSCIIGQIHVTQIKDFKEFKRLIELHKETLIQSANQSVVAGLKKRGGGVQEIQVRALPSHHAKESFNEAVVHILLDPVEAMGANAVTQVCEFLKRPIQMLTQATPKIAIVSNLNDHKIVKATIEIETVESQTAEAIEEASRFAEIDPYRAATHNKGVLNGIDAILVATGNDWRAVEANIHAYAAREGQYSPITHWRKEGKRLVGRFKAPITLGIVGGVTAIHPFAQFSLRLMNIQSSNQLARIVAGVGLVQNLGALRALTHQGLIQGHMKLHINNLMLAAGVKDSEKTSIRSELERLLKKQNKLNLTDVQLCLKALRKRKEPMQ